MGTEPLIIDENLARRLVAAQFPQWKDLPITPVANGGHDNRTFHLGDEMLIRMPSSEVYASAVEKEQQWLPKLAAHLSVPIPVPVAMGEPGEGYPWKWSINKWLDGEEANPESIKDKSLFAKDLAQFLKTLQSIDATGGPEAGVHSFFRGGSLMNYDSETREAIRILSDQIDAAAVLKVWETAIDTSWRRTPAWVHGDISLSNLLVQNGRLCAVIDFGQLAIGDPACDLAIAWTFFEGKSRDIFRKELGLDEGTWGRGRAWALWKALIVLSGRTSWGTHLIPLWWQTLGEVMKDDKSSR